VARSLKAYRTCGLPPAPIGVGTGVVVGLAAVLIWEESYSPGPGDQELLPVGLHLEAATRPPTWGKTFGTTVLHTAWPAMDGGQSTVWLPCGMPVASTTEIMTCTVRFPAPVITPWTVKPLPVLVNCKQLSIAATGHEPVWIIPLAVGPCGGDSSTWQGAPLGRQSAGLGGVGVGVALGLGVAVAVAVAVGALVTVALGIGVDVGAGVPVAGSVLAGVAVALGGFEMVGVAVTGAVLVRVALGVAVGGTGLALVIIGRLVSMGGIGPRADGAPTSVGVGVVLSSRISWRCRCRSWSSRLISASRLMRASCAWATAACACSRANWCRC
jgi:hypothetical protein